eukprot:TRINITY_DN13532_c1_g1_i1.p1 TRINITY_DN13532_c1_g1~~TRINITY_DN13532_c1_g1_i1.p1  ORF type:complete len:94 (+),score=5.09 TRINITY_DN13532_c1_g1_i1:229-510(+)
MFKNIVLKYLGRSENRSSSGLVDHVAHSPSTFELRRCSFVWHARNFMHINFVHRDLRNRLSRDKVEKLVFIYHNRRALRRFQGPEFRLFLLMF